MKTILIVSTDLTDYNKAKIKLFENLLVESTNISDYPCRAITVEGEQYLLPYNNTNKWLIEKLKQEIPIDVFFMLKM